MAAAGAEVTGPELTDLLNRTEGWPVGLYFAALSGNPGAFPPSPPSSFEGDDRLLTDYIRSEFLSHLPEDQVRFMIRTLVLDELCGPLCDDVLRRRGSAAILEEIEAANLLLVPLDRQRRWYRFHRLFQRTLRHELSRTEPGGTTQELARRASAWCESNDQLDQAVHYAQVAGDAARVGEMVVRGGMAQFAIGRAATLREWFDWLAAKNCPDSTVAILGAWLNLALGRPTDAQRWATVAAAADQNMMMPDGSPLNAWVLPLRATLAQDVRQMHDDASAALRLTPEGGLWQPAATVILGLAESYLGNPGQAETLLARGVDLGIERAAPAEVIVGCAGRAAIAISQDRWHDAAAHLRRASSLIETSGLDSYPVTALVHAAAARVAAHDRDPWTARRQLSAAARLLPALNSALAPLAIQARLQYLRACVMLGDTLSTENLLDEVNELLRGGRGFGALSAEAAEVTELIRHAHAAAPLLAKLTPAELRLIPLLATQLTSREIATQLSVSVHTVKTQIASIYRKLQVSSRTEAIDQARHQRLLDD